jgi:hypothetical protein
LSIATVARTPHPSTPHGATAAPPPPPRGAFGRSNACSFVYGTCGIRASHGWYASGTRVEPSEATVKLPVAPTSTYLRRTGSGASSRAGVCCARLRVRRADAAAAPERLRRARCRHTARRLAPRRRRGE